MSGEEYRSEAAHGLGAFLFVQNKKLMEQRGIRITSLRRLRIQEIWVVWELEDWIVGVQIFRFFGIHKGALLLS